MTTSDRDERIEQLEAEVSELRRKVAVLGHAVQKLTERVNDESI